MQGMEFLETADMDVDLGAMGIRTSLTVLYRYSPLCSSITVHWDLAVYRSTEICARVSLEKVHIMQGAALLYREIGENCTRRRSLGQSGKASWP